MKALRSMFALAVCAAAAGCASVGESTRAANGPGVMQVTSISPQRAKEAVSVGASTKADVAAALGKANVIHFDSGYEVWLYRWPGADRATRGDTEFVILFAPNGVVKKTRIRPSYAH